MKNPEARLGYRMHQLGHQIRQRMRNDAWIVRSVVRYGRLGLNLESASPNQAPDMIHTTGQDRQAALMHVVVEGQDLVAYGLNARGPERQCGTR